MIEFLTALSIIVGIILYILASGQKRKEIMPRMFRRGGGSSVDSLHYNIKNEGNGSATDLRVEKLKLPDEYNFSPETCKQDILKVGEKFSIYFHNKIQENNTYKYIKENNITIKMEITFFDGIGSNKYKQIFTIFPSNATNVSKPKLIRSKVWLWILLIIVVWFVVTYLLSDNFSRLIQSIFN